MEIIDFRVRPRVPIFYKGLWPDPTPANAAYIKLFNAAGKRRMQPATFEEALEEMRGAGVSRAVIFAGDAEATEAVRDAVQKYPDAYIGLAGVRADRGVQKAYQDLKTAYLEYGLRGLNMSPYLTGVYATDPRNYPLYQLSEELGRCCVIHTSVHYNPEQPLDLSDPNQIDKLAVQFPKLKLVITHGGVGFGELAPNIAARHENVFLDLTSIHPRIIPPMILKLVNTQLKRKIIYGTNYPCFEFNIYEEWKKVIEPDNQDLFFRKNALRALGLDEA